MLLKNIKVADLTSANQNKSNPLYQTPFHSDESLERLKLKDFSKQVKDFTEKTSCHGVNRVSDTQSPNNWFRWKNILWLALCITSLAMACQSLVTILEDYLSYPTSTMIKEEFEIGAEFPAVTFCNLNVVVPSRLPYYNGLEVLWESFRQDPNNTLNVDDDYKLEQMKTIFASLTTQEKKAVGHSIEEMLIDCDFGGVPCSKDDFYWSHNSNFGNCYSFNFGFSSDGRDQEIRKARNIGKGAGLSVTLDVQSELYLNMTKEIGITFMTHQSRVFQFIEEKGMVASPGFLTSLGLYKKESILAEPPYGICVRADSERNKNVNMYASIGYRYTTKMCQGSCEQAHAIRACGCCETNIPCNPDGLPKAFGITFPNNGNVSVCNMSDWTVAKCILSAIADVRRTGECSRECYPACNLVSYDVKYSMAVWPNRFQTEDIFQRVNESGRVVVEDEIGSSGSISIKEKNSFLRDNVVKLEVHLETLSKVVTSTKPVYTWNSLLSNVGGQLGLWLGFSVLTGVEFIELLLDAIVFGVKMLYRRWRSPAET